MVRRSSRRVSLHRLLPPPGCDVISRMALGLRCATVGMMLLYRSTLVWTTLAYDCSLLQAFAVTTTTLEPAEADRSDRGEENISRSTWSEPTRTPADEGSSMKN